MLLLIGLLLFVTLAFLVLLLPALSLRESFNRYSGTRAVTCPETHQQVAVKLDALQAARTELEEHPQLHLSDCSRWPERWNCDRACLSDALQAEVYRGGEVVVRSKKIYHLPVLLAAFAAWYIGAVWHSHYLFRARWMEDLDLTPAQVKEMVHWYSPHLLSIAVCLLFAYGVAWLLAVGDRRGIPYGILHALFLAIAVAVVASPNLGGLPTDLLFLELGYTLIAAIVVGAIIGGLSGKLIAPEWMTDHEARVEPRPR